MQCFNKHTWDNVIRKTPTSTRSYCIALAIEFSDYVMAFLSIDQLIQVLYSFFKQLENSLTNFLALVGCQLADESKLPLPPHDVYSSYPEFLAEVSNWIRECWTLGRLSYACEVIRKQGRGVFGGVGVYTICELFFDAGMSPLSILASIC